MERMIRIPAYRVRLERWVWIVLGMVLGLLTASCCELRDGTRQRPRQHVQPV